MVKCLNLFEVNPIMKLVSVKLFFVIAILLFKTSFIFSQENEIAMPYLKGDMYGYGNSKGEIVIEPKYDYVLLFENGYAMVRLDNKWGLIKQNGQVLFEPIAKQISPFDSNGLAEVIVENKSGVINTKGDWVVPREYTMVDIKFNFIAVTNSQNQAALLDLSGKKIVDFKYNNFRFPESSFNFSHLIITELDQQFGLIEMERNGKFKEHITPQYQSLRFLSDSLFEAKKNDKSGLVNSKGDIIAPFDYTDFKKEGQYIIAEQEIAYEVRMKLIEQEVSMAPRWNAEIEKEYDDKNKIVYYLMTREEKDQLESRGIDFNDRNEIRILYSLISEQGQIIIPAQFGEISLNKHFIQVRTDDGVTIFNKNGKQASLLLFEQVDEIKEGLILVKVRAEENGSEVLLDSADDGNEMIDHYNQFKFGFMDSTAGMILPLNYNGAFAFNRNRAPVRQGDKWALINKKGELLTDYKYDQLYYAGENRYAFRLGKRWGLLDLNGGEIIPAKYFEYKYASHETDQFGGYSGLVFENGKAKTSKQLPGFGWASTTLIDTNGVQLFPFKYMTIEEQVGGLFKVSLRNHDHDGDSYGLIDQDGNVIVPVYQNNIWWLENEEVFVVSKYAFKNNYSYYDRNGQKIDSPYKHIEREGLREYKRLSSGYYSAKYRQYTVYFTPDGIPLFEE
jgi:hypothetical protein